MSFVSSHTAGWAKWRLAAGGQTLALCVDCRLHEVRHFCLFCPLVSCPLLSLCLEECLAHSGRAEDAVDRAKKQWCQAWKTPNYAKKAKFEIGYYT